VKLPVKVTDLSLDESVNAACSIAAGAAAALEALAPPDEAAAEAPAFDVDVAADDVVAVFAPHPASSASTEPAASVAPMKVLFICPNSSPRGTAALAPTPSVLVSLSFGGGYAVS
jgi:hypothetical protein